MLKATISFDGCSCGCTPSRFYRIEEETLDRLYDECARIFYINRIHGDNPYRKVTAILRVPNSSREEIIKRADIINGLHEKIDEITCKMEKLELRTGPFSCAPGYNLTDEQIAINKVVEVAVVQVLSP